MKKNGFTLTELLVTIVILAVLALIVTPTVVKIINQAKEQANMKSVEGHIKNVEYAINEKTIGTGKTLKYDVTNGLLNAEIVLPEGDRIVCSLYTIKSGKVIEAKYCQDNSWNKMYSYSSVDGVTLTKFNGTFVSADRNETHKGVIYMDPTNLSTVCTDISDIDVSSRTTKSGCMKFYIFDDSGDNYKLLLDRNTTAKVAWANHDDYIAAGGTETDWTAERYNTKGSVTVTKQLKKDTSGWVGSPRLIRESEIRTITGNNGTGSYYFGSNDTTAYEGQTEAQKAIQQSFHWLFDYTSECIKYGCEIASSSSSGYWTGDAVSGNARVAWYVHRYGLLNYSSTYDVTATNYGVRPVIEIPKALIKNQEKDSDEKTLLAHLTNIELQISKNATTPGMISQYDVTNGLLSSEIQLPDNDNVVCTTYTVRNGKVVDAQYCASNKWNNVYSYSKDNGVTLKTFNITFVPASVGETHKGVVYLDPSDLSRECNEDSTITTANTGCKKFYIYGVNGSYYQLLIDRNTTGRLAWASLDDYIAAGGTEANWTASKYNILGPVTVTKQLKIDTVNWIGSPRLIKQAEIRTIIGNTGSSSSYFGSGNGSTVYADQTDTQKEKQRSFHWLFDYTNSCTTYGCKTADSSASGYWTGDAVSGSTSNAWSVHRFGLLNNVGASGATTYGVRPVIELPIPLVTPFKGTTVAKASGETHKGIVYFDPSNLSKSCTSSSTITSTNTGCKKFYIYDDSGDYYKLLMDRNTTGKLAWASYDDYIAAGGTEEDWTASKYNTQGPVTVTKQLKTDTANWIGNPRLIKQAEIRAITGNTGTGIYYFGSNNTTAYASQTEEEQAIQQSFHWLFDYTNACTTYGCQTANSSTNGYWTSDVVSGNISLAWYVYRYGSLNSIRASNDTNFGIRPVLELSSSVIK